MTESRKNELIARRFALHQRLRELSEQVLTVDFDGPQAWYNFAGTVNDGVVAECDAIGAGIETA